MTYLLVAPICYTIIGIIEMVIPCLHVTFNESAAATHIRSAVLPRQQAKRSHQKYFICNIRYFNMHCMWFICSVNGMMINKVKNEREKTPFLLSFACVLGALLLSYHDWQYFHFRNPFVFNVFSLYFFWEHLEMKIYMMRNVIQCVWSVCEWIYIKIAIARYLVPFILSAYPATIYITNECVFWIVHDLWARKEFFIQNIKEKIFSIC